MKLYGFCLFVLLTASAAMFTQACEPPTAKSNEEIDKKIKALEDQSRSCASNRPP